MVKKKTEKKKKEAMIKGHDVIELMCSLIGAPTVICQVTTVSNISEFSHEKNFLINVQMNRILFILKLVLVALT